MANIVEGGPARVVPLTYYDEDGNRYVVGKAKAKLRNGELMIDGVFELAEDSPYSHEFNINNFDFEPVPQVR